MLIGPSRDVGRADVGWAWLRTVVPVDGDSCRRRPVFGGERFIRLGAVRWGNRGEIGRDLDTALGGVRVDLVLDRELPPAGGGARGGGRAVASRGDGGHGPRPRTAPGAGARNPGVLRWRLRGRRLVRPEGPPLETATTDLAPRCSRTSVEGEVEPGLYATAFGTAECSYELWRSWTIETPARSARSTERGAASRDRRRHRAPTGSRRRIRAASGTGGSRCPTPLTEAGDGDYWVGDLSRGVWFVPEPCRWEKVVAFRGVRLADVTASGSGPRIAHDRRGHPRHPAARLPLPDQLDVTGEHVLRP